MTDVVHERRNSGISVQLQRPKKRNDVLLYMTVDIPNARMGSIGRSRRDSRKDYLSVYVKTRLIAMTSGSGARTHLVAGIVMEKRNASRWIVPRRPCRENGKGNLPHPIKKNFGRGRRQFRNPPEIRFVFTLPQFKATEGDK